MSGRGAEPARVRFYRAPDRELFVLEVDLPSRDHESALDRFVQDLKLRVIHGERQTQRRRRISRWYVKEQDGTSVTEARQLEIQTGILTAILGPGSARRERLQSFVD